MFLVYRFANPALPKSAWSSTLQAKCGWGPSWEPALVTGCVDPRGCPPPPPRNSIYWGSYEDSPTKSLDVGTTYWYSCRAGLFAMPNGNLVSYIDLTCVNADGGGAPFWNPPYDYDVNPFPECQNQGESKFSNISLKLHCDTHFQRTFNACRYVFKVITLVSANLRNYYFENTTSCSKRSQKTRVATQLDSIFKDIMEISACILIIQSVSKSLTG